MLQPLEWKRQIETGAPTYCSWYLIHKTWGRHVSPLQDFHKTCWCCPQCTSSCSHQTQQTQPAAQCLLLSGGERAGIKAPIGSYFLIALSREKPHFRHLWEPMMYQILVRDIANTWKQTEGDQRTQSKVPRGKMLPPSGTFKPVCVCSGALFSTKDWVCSRWCKGGAEGCNREASRPSFPCPLWYQ